MRVLIFIAIVLVAGALAGLVHGIVNFMIVEPFLDESIELENQRLFAAGQEDTPEFRAEYEGYRMWQKGGQIFASVILGISMGSLFGIAYYLIRDRLPGNRYIKKSLTLAIVMWVVMFLVPFLKYPAELPGTGSTDTVDLRTLYYLSLVIASGAGAIACYKIMTSLKKYGKLVGLVCYVALVSVLYVVMPSNTIDADIPGQLTDNFRIMSVIGVLSFWLANGFLLGLLWKKLEPNQVAYRSR